MIGNIFGAIVRQAVAITLVTGAAGAMVAGSVDLAPSQSVGTRTATIAAETTAKKTTNEVSDLVRACLASKDPKSEECAKAIEKSGASAEDFWAKLAMSLANAQHRTDAKDEPAKHETPKSDTTAKSNEQPKTGNEETYALVKDCLSKYEHAKDAGDGAEQASAACRKAIEATGLTADEFWKRVNPKREVKPETTKRPEPTRKPEATPKSDATPSVSTAQLEVLVKDCFTKYLAAKNSGGSSEAGTAAGEACRKAISASGLSPEAFFKKFGTPGNN